ncbi:hypothetical protein V6Z11_D03G194400 [Gossypium hirsutum]
MLRLITNQKLTNPLSIQGDLVQKEDEQLILYLPLPPDTGKGAEIHNNPEVIDQEEPAKEVNLTLAYVGEILVKLRLKNRNKQNKRWLLRFCWTFPCQIIQVLLVIWTICSGLT